MFFFRCCAAGMPHLLLAMSKHMQGTQASCLRRVWKTRHAEAICAIREICEGHIFLADLADFTDYCAELIICEHSCSDRRCGIPAAQ